MAFGKPDLPLSRDASGRFLPGKVHSNARVKTVEISKTSSRVVPAMRNRGSAESLVRFGACRPGDGQVMAG